MKEDEQEQGKSMMEFVHQGVDQESRRSDDCEEGTCAYECVGGTASSSNMAATLPD